MVVFDVKDNELMIKVLFTFVVGITSYMRIQNKGMRCQVRGHNTKNPNIFNYKFLENENVEKFYETFTYMIFSCTFYF